MNVARLRGRLDPAVALLFVSAVALSSVLSASPTSGSTAANAGGELVSVIVRRLPGAGRSAEEAVTRLGGRVGTRLEIIHSFAATVPAGSVAALSAAPGVASVAPDGVVTLLGGDKDGRWEVDARDLLVGDDDRDGDWRADHDLGSVRAAARRIEANNLRDGDGRRLDGRGVGVALIDSGVAPVQGLDDPGRIVNGPDLSFESQAPGLEHLDTFGHGTHMAGIIAGSDGGAPSTSAGGDEDDGHGRDGFRGIAPGATLLSVKVASADGATDVSQVIAALDWVVQHRDDQGMNIRVINLSFGTQALQPYTVDPLAHAAEVAWRRGIVVVVAAGNDGLGQPVLTNPAIDPYVLAVGASDHNATRTELDDVVADFTNRGNARRHPDVVAPGRSIVSLRTPGSHIDLEHPEGRVAGDESGRFFRGSGTSQAAAVTSGAVALLLQHRPELTPDQVKRLLKVTADPLLLGDAVAQGKGEINLERAVAHRVPTYVQTWPTSTGTGSLELARGGSHVADPDDGTELVGEQDIMGEPWDGRTWSQLAWEGRTWSGGDWNGRTWSGGDWTGESWTGRTWSGRTWSGRTWSGRTWSGRTWSDNVWDGRTWSGRTWSGRTWSGRTWSGRTWSGVTWR